MGSLLNRFSNPEREREREREREQESNVITPKRRAGQSPNCLQPTPIWIVYLLLLFVEQFTFLKKHRNYFSMVNTVDQL